MPGYSTAPRQYPMEGQVLRFRNWCDGNGSKVEQGFPFHSLHHVYYALPLVSFIKEGMKPRCKRKWGKFKTNSSKAS